MHFRNRAVIHARPHFLSINVECNKFVTHRNQWIDTLTGFVWRSSYRSRPKGRRETISWGGVAAAMNAIARITSTPGW